MPHFGITPIVGNKLYGDLDLNGYNITGAGQLTGGISVTDQGDATVNLAAEDCYGQLYQMTRAGAQTVNLPPVVEGMMVTILATAAQVITVDPDNADRIKFGATTKADGVAIISGGTAGAQITLYGDSADGWTVLGYVGSWT